MKILKFFLIIFSIILGLIVLAIVTSPLWINFPYPKRTILRAVEEFKLRRSPSINFKIGDYTTNILNKTQFEKVSVFFRSGGKNDLHLILDRAEVKYDLSRIFSGMLAGQIKYGSAVLVYKIQYDETRGSYKVYFRTNRIDLEEIDLKILKRFYKEQFALLSLHGRLRLRGCLEIDNEKTTLSTLIRCENIYIKFREYNFKIERLNGYMPVHETFYGPVTRNFYPHGRLTAERISYGKIKFRDVVSKVTYKYFGAVFNPLQCRFFNTTALGAGSMRLINKKIYYSFRAGIKKLDFKSFDELINNPDYGADGYGNGEIDVAGVGNKVSACIAKIESIKPGGTIRAVALKKLLNYLPNSDIKDKVGVVINKRDDFKYVKAVIALEKKKKKYILNLYLDGDHLLDFTINIDEELIDDIFWITE